MLTNSNQAIVRVCTHFDGQCKFTSNLVLQICNTFAPFANISKSIFSSSALRWRNMFLGMLTQGHMQLMLFPCPGLTGCYIFPPFSLIWHIGKGTQGQSCGNTNSSCLAHTGLVPSACTFSSTTASTVATVRGSANSTTQPGVPPSEVQDEASCLGCVRKSLSDKGISSQATNLICASWTTGTEKQHQAVWKKWRGWCRERNVDSLQAHVSQV